MSRAFFDVIIHLTLHVGEELDICEPMHSRWMYLIVRTMGAFKKYVHNRVRLESSHLLDETLDFVTKHV
jgi:hypothetical protein